MLCYENSAFYSEMLKRVEVSVNVLRRQPRTNSFVPFDEFTFESTISCGAVDVNADCKLSSTVNFQ